MIKPALRLGLWNDSVELAIFGLNETAKWKELRNVKNGLEKEMDFEPGVALLALGEIAEEMKIGRIYMPKADFSARLAKTQEFTNEIKLVNAINRELMRGTDADGLESIPINCAYALLGGDCMIGIGRDEITGNVVGFHAGRDSLLNMPRILGEPPKREHETVIEKVCEALGGGDENTDFFLGCSIGPQYFDHHWHKHPNNPKIIPYVIQCYGRASIYGPMMTGGLDLKAIAYRQLETRGVMPMNIEEDGIDTFGDKHSDGQPIFGSNKRDGSRNLIIVVNRG